MRRRDTLRAGASLLGVGLFGVPATARRDTAAFTPQGTLSLFGTKEGVVSEDGTTAYLAVTDGYATVDLSDPANPELLAERRDLLEDRAEGPLKQVYDVKRSGDTLAIAGPANPTRGETISGVYLADVSDPANPSKIGFHETNFSIHNCVFEGDYVYLTANNVISDGVRRNPVVIVDTSGEEPTEVARWSLSTFDEEWESVGSSFRVLHDVWVQDGLAALAHWDAGTYLLDVSDPTAPEHLGTIPALSPDELRTATGSEYTSSPGNHHYVATDETNELLAVGGESWAYTTDDGYEGGPSGIDLYDVSDPTAPEKQSRIEPPESNNPTYRGTWTTSHNFELRDGTLYSSWYQGGVKRHDVSDPANPTELSWWADPDRGKFWTAQAAVPGEFFLATSMETDATDAGVWTFPETDGTGGNPAALTATPTPSPTPSPTESPTESPTASATATATDTAPATDSTDSGAGQETTDTRAPGFGVVGTLGAVGGAGLAAWRRLGGDSGSEE